MAKKGTRLNPRAVNVKLSDATFWSDSRLIKHVHKAVSHAYKISKPGQFIAVNIKHEEEDRRGREVIIKEGTFLVKKGKRKPTKESLRAIARSVNAALSEKYGLEGTPETEDEIEPYIGSPEFSPELEFKPTPEKKRKAEVTRLPFKKDKGKRYHDTKGRFTSGRPYRDKAGRWRDRRGYIASAAKRRNR